MKDPPKKDAAPRPGEGIGASVQREEQHHDSVGRRGGAGGCGGREGAGP